jgi:hypothetical protein
MTLIAMDFNSQVTIVMIVTIATMMSAGGVLFGIRMKHRATEAENQKREAFQDLASARERLSLLEAKSREFDKLTEEMIRIL